MAEEQQFGCVHCGTSLTEEDEFEQIPDDYSDDGRDIKLEDTEVICKDCLDDYNTQINRLAVKGSNSVPPKKDANIKAGR